MRVSAGQSPQDQEKAMAELRQDEYFGVRVARQVRLTIPLSAVESVIRVSARQICPIPGVSPDLLGVVNRAGSLIWVFDLCRFLQMSPSEDEEPSVGVVLRGNPWPSQGSRQIRRVACLVSQLEGIFPLPAQPLQPLPTQLAPALRQVFMGLASRPVASLPLDAEVTAAVEAQTTPQWTKAAVLDPEALFAYLYAESDASHPPLRVHSGASILPSS